MFWPLHDPSHRGGGAAGQSVRLWIEQLEGRQLLAASFMSTLQPVVTRQDGVPAIQVNFRQASANLSSLTDVTGRFGGSVKITRVSAVLIGSVRRNVTLAITRQTTDGQLDGIIDINGVGSFDVNGFVGPRNRIQLLFGGGTGGSLTGKVKRHGALLTGTMALNHGTAIARGRFRLTRLLTADVNVALAPATGFGNPVSFGFGNNPGFNNGFGFNNSLLFGGNLDNRITGMLSSTNLGLNPRSGFVAASNLGTNPRTGFLLGNDLAFGRDLTGLSTDLGLARTGLTSVGSNFLTMADFSTMGGGPARLF
jgi:hypothetical protein